MDFSAWVVSGLMLVAGATWLIVYNADVLLGATMRVAGRVRALAPVLKMAMAYPLRVRFRTGVTLAMFTLVVFTIVVGATTSRAFLRGDRRRRGLRRRLRRHRPGRADEPARRRARGRAARGARRRSPSSPARPCCRPRWRRPATASSSTYPLRGFDDSFLNTTTYGLAALRQGLRLAARGLAGALAPPGPRRDRRAGRAAARQLGLRRRRPSCACTASTSRTRRSTRCRSSSATRAPATTKTLTVIGVLADTVPIEMAGLWTSHQTARDDLRRARRARPSTTCRSRPGVDPDAAARRLERAFLENGMEAESVRSVLHDAIGASYTRQLAAARLHGPRADRRRRRARRRSAPARSSSAASRSACCARSASAAAWSSSASCSSRRSSR